MEIAPGHRRPMELRLQHGQKHGHVFEPQPNARQLEISLIWKFGVVPIPVDGVLVRGAATAVEARALSRLQSILWRSVSFLIRGDHDEAWGQPAHFARFTQLSRGTNTLGVGLGSLT